jgi:hypothetical protein
MVELRHRFYSLLFKGGQGSFYNQFSSRNFLKLPPLEMGGGGVYKSPFFKEGLKIPVIHVGLGL